MLGDLLAPFCAAPAGYLGPSAPQVPSPGRQRQPGRRGRRRSPRFLPSREQLPSAACQATPNATGTAPAYGAEKSPSATPATANAPAAKSAAPPRPPSSTNSATCTTSSTKASPPKPATPTTPSGKPPKTGSPTGSTA